MKRVLRTAMMALLVMLLCVGMLAPAASAATQEAKIPVEITCTGSDPVDDAYAELQLIPITEGAPMPANPTVKIHLDPGTGTVSIPCDTYGVFQYEIRMVGGTYFVPEDYDIVYNVLVYYLNTGVEIRIYRGDMELQVKPDALEFEIPLTEVSVKKMWSDVNTKHDPITVNLLLNEKTVVDSVVLGDENDGWKHTFTGLNARLGDYSVVEAKVPSGYTATYKEASKNNWVITNTKSLLQTGQLNWPIPVLASAGMLFVAVGYLMLRKKEEKNA